LPLRPGRGGEPFDCPFGFAQGCGSGQALGGSEYVTVAELVQTVIDVSGKEIHIQYVDGPGGVHSRNPSASSGRAFDKARSQKLGWEARTLLKEGIAQTHPWIEEQVRESRE
jgi:GDP-D-mannose 3',5'-epimerase